MRNFGAFIVLLCQIVVVGLLPEFSARANSVDPQRSIPIKIKPKPMDQRAQLSLKLVIRYASSYLESDQPLLRRAAHQLVQVTTEVRELVLRKMKVSEQLHRELKEAVEVFVSSGPRMLDAAGARETYRSFLAFLPYVYHKYYASSYAAQKIARLASDAMEGKSGVNEPTDIAARLYDAAMEAFKQITYQEQITQRAVDELRDALNAYYKVTSPFYVDHMKWLHYNFLIHLKEVKVIL